MSPKNVTSSPGRSIHRPWLLLAALLMTVAGMADSRSPLVSTTILITQVYGGGGNSGATWRHDFVELRNIGAAPVDLTGWSLHYAAATGTTWQRTPLAGVVAPGAYFLIQQASGGGSGAVLPAADLTGTVAMAATAGKLVLTRTSSPLTGGAGCPVGVPGVEVVDLVGYGTAATCFEGTAPAPAPGSATAVARLDRGCTDTDQNGTDFQAVPPVPRHGGTAVTPCGAPTSPTGQGVVWPSPTTPGGAVTIEVAVTPGGNPPSTGITVTVDLTPSGVTLDLLDDGRGVDAAGGDYRYTGRHILPAGLAPGTYQLDCLIRDGEGRQGRLRLPLVVVAPSPPSPVVISQIFAAGGNSGAPFTHDWIELFNRSSEPVSLSGWSIQYATATGAAWAKLDLSGLIGPGRYYLIQLGSGGTAGVAPPAPDLRGSFNLSSSAGKIVLARQGAAFSSPCPVGAARADLVGYGDAATCFEGEGPASPPGTAALLRWGDGCRDGDRHDRDWRVGTPRPRQASTAPLDCATYQAAIQAGPGGQQAGSLLIYPFYSSLSANPRDEETRLTLTNISQTTAVGVHLFWVDGQGTTVADSRLYLTASQTTTFVASESDPDVSGYLLALAIDPLTGVPINFNQLIGDSYLRLAGGMAANLVATSVQAIEPSPAVSDATGVTAELRFDGDHYQPLPAMLAASHLPSPADGRERVLIIDRLEGSLLTGLRTVGELAGLLYDDREAAHSFTVNSARRQLRLTLADRALRLTPRLSTIVPNGRSGWLKLSRPDGGALIGILLDADGHGRGLHVLTLAPTATLTVPLVGGPVEPARFFSKGRGEEQ